MVLGILTNKVYSQVPDSLTVEESLQDTLISSDTLIYLEEDSSWLPTDIGKFGIYLEGTYSEVPGPASIYPLYQLGFGITLNRFFAGAFISEVQKVYEHTLVFPNTFEMTYKYGGAYLGSHVIRRKPFEIDIRMSLGKGDMVWQQKDRNRLLLRDEYYVYQPELQVVYVPITYLKIFLSGSYRIIDQLNIQGVNQGELSGLVYGFGIRLGFYK